MENKIKEITEACYKANPQLEGRNTSMLLKGEFDGIINHRDKTIRLSDVLLAIQSEYVGSLDVTVSPEGFIRDEQEDRNATWNLRANTLEAQSPETLTFIADIIKSKN